MTARIWPIVKQICTLSLLLSNFLTTTAYLWADMSLHLPLTVAVSVPDAIAHAKASGLTVIAADGDGALSLDDVIDDGRLAQPTAWVFGNEAWGLPDDGMELCDLVVAVPIYGQAESLNLGTAAAVCLYASAREQRR